MKETKSSSYDIDATLTQSDVGLNIKPREIQGLTIVQDFTNKVLDEIMVRCTFMPMDLLSILENAQDLKFTLIERRWERDVYDVVATEAPDVYTFKAIVANPQDELKKLPPAVFKKTQETDYDRDILQVPMPLDLQLMTETAYSLKNSSGVNAILADTDVSSVILYLANIWNIEKIEMIEPENKKKYDQIIIPPLSKYEDVFNTLKKQYGLYNKGTSNYYVNGVLHVYPPFESQPQQNNVVNIFKLPEGSVDGGDTYHKQDGDDLWIACFGKTATVNTAQSSTENVGNAVAVRQADTSLTAGRSVDNNGKITLNNQSSIIAKYNSSSTNTKQQVSTSYGGSTSNIFEQLSNISAGQLEHVGVYWLHAKPYLIKPGMKCILHYDDISMSNGSNTDIYTTAPGIVEYVEYKLSVHAKTPSLVYKWSASIIVGVAPKERDASQTASATPNQ